MRQFIRHPSDIPLDCSLAQPDSTQRHCLKDISAGGLCFQSGQALPQGGVVRLTIPVREPPFEVMGTIMWCSRINSHYEVGVQFADAGTEFAVRMVEQVCHIHHYQRQVLAQEGRVLSGAEAAAEWVHQYAQDFPT